MDHLFIVYVDDITERSIPCDVADSSHIVAFFPAKIPDVSQQLVPRKRSVLSPDLGVFGETCTPVVMIGDGLHHDQDLLADGYPGSSVTVGL